MKNFVDNIEKLTEQNKNFRKVLFTAKEVQLVVMTLKPREDIGYELHKDVDQFFRIEEGNAHFVFNKKVVHMAKPGYGVIVSAGTGHNVINPSRTKSLKLYTIYSPPNHPANTVHRTKKEAEEAEKH